ncbi:putative glutamine amidotransferase involved in pyridoxine biosynthesis [Desulfitobacterium dichloroeliminans LMG P-21439]|uniref:Putative glutamine amidotransferase involved in pyridoxine biosynthesis n=1 Tax=Desulfitobacterium dichloroeliminans (strain LMG P-21439 / DCA1) TaxID=871963 RepID=L0F4K5_DESDL|nr:putative glutamine amidotransferase involved in pyridoxine biosynthesis [Desulfitobacterium dichloroeliminans LMG P-21439]
MLSLDRTFNRPCLSYLDPGFQVIEVRTRENCDSIHGLLIVGSENLPEAIHFPEEIGERIKELAGLDFPIYGICAGMVLMSKGSPEQGNNRLGLMDVTVAGELMASKIETYLSIPALGTKPVKAVFDESHYIQEVAPNVGILSEYNGKIVFVRQGNLLASAFHPDSSADDRVYRYFLDIVNGKI